MLRTTLWFIGLIGLALLVYIRVAPMPASRWHVDPLLAPMPDTPNTFRLDPGAPEAQFDESADVLMARFDALLMAEPRVTRLAGSVAGRWVTYVVRSRFLGYPDAVSVRALPRKGGGAALAIFSRSRFGRSDFGVNRTRVRRWLKALHRSPRSR